MTHFSAGRTGLWLLVVYGVLGVVAWVAGGPASLPLRNSPPPDAGEQIAAVMSIVLALAAALLAAAPPTPFNTRPGRGGWALLAVAAVALVVGSEAPFLTNVYSLSWPFWLFLPGLGAAMLAIAMIIIAALRSNGPGRAAGFLVGVGLANVVLGLPAPVSLLACGLLGIGVVWLEWLARQAGQPRADASGAST